MRAAVAEEMGGIDRVKLGERPDPVPKAGEALIRIHAAGVGPWDPLFVSGGSPSVAAPFVPGQEIAGVVEAAGDGADVKAGERVYASLFPAGGGFADYAVATMEGLAHMPDRMGFEDAAALVIGAGTAYEGLVDRGGLHAGETVLVTAASGGVGSTAVQIVAAMGARPLGVASPANHEFVRALGATDVFDYHAGDWAERVRAAVPGGVDLLFDAAGGETRQQAVAAVRDDGRVITLVPDIAPDQPPFGPRQFGRGIMGEAFPAHITRERLEALNRLFDEGKLHAEVQAVLPLEQARQALEQVAGRHTRGKVVVQITG